MKKSYIILHILFLIVLTSFASAVNIDTADIGFCTNDGITPTEDSADYLVLNTDGDNTSWIGDGNYIYQDNVVGYGNFITAQGGANDWFGQSSGRNISGISMYFYSHRTNNSNTYEGTFIGSSTVPVNQGYNNAFEFVRRSDEVWAAYDEGWQLYSPAITIPYNTWINFTIVMNHSDDTYDVYHWNGTVWHLGLNDIGARGTASPSDLVRIYLDNSVVHVDNIRWFNVSDGDYSCPELIVTGIPVTPTIVAPSPADDSHNNTNVTLNVTHSTAQNDVRYYLYFGDSTPTDESDLYLFNVTRSGDEYRSFETNVSDGVFYWKFRVYNISSNTYSANTTERTLIIDTVTPIITLENNNGFSIDNSTILSPYITNFSINISFFDTYLYQTLINISNETNNNVTTILNSSIGGKTTANYSRILDISNWAIGNYTIKLMATDSHTAKSIKPYGVIKGLNYLRYTTQEGNTIKITSDTLPLTFSTNKLQDRYDFKFNYLFSKEKYKFRIESYNKINYIQNSNYKAHFVIIGSNGRGNWIDFNNPNLSKKDYRITKIDDYIYEVEITPNGLKSFTFSSIGGLNVVEEHYKIRLAAVLDIQIGDDETGNWINATVTIGNQTINTTVINQSSVTPARFVNITKETTSLSLTATGYGTEAKTMSVTEKYHNFSFNMTEVSATKLYFYDEKSESLIEGETFSVYLETTGFSQTYSAATNPYTISSLQRGLYKLKASSTNYPERQYLNLNISNVTTTNLNIYLINSTLGSEKTFTIRDVGINPLEDVRVNFLRIINGTPTVIAEENSDFAGQVKLTLDSNNLYIINFSKAGFRTRIINLEPVDSVYAITLTSTTEVIANQSIGITYKFRPIETVLNNNTKYNFTFTLNSTAWLLTNCTLRLKNGTILLNETSSYTSTSCHIRIEQNTFNMTNITSEAIYELDSSQTITVSKQYVVIFTFEGQFSLKNFIDDLSDLGDAGFNNFTRFIIALITIMVIVSSVAKNVNFTNPDALILLTWALVGFFSFIGWFSIDYQNIPDIFGLRQYIVFVLVSLVTLAFFIDKFGR